MKMVTRRTSQRFLKDKANMIYLIYLKQAPTSGLWKLQSLTFEKTVLSSEA